MALKTQPFGQNIAEAIEGLRLDADKVNAAYDHSQTIGNPHQTTKEDVGLGNVDNTSDANKPVSTATQTALNKKVDKVSGKSLISDTEIERLASVHNYDDTEIRAEIEQKTTVTTTTTTTHITDSADGYFRDFDAFGKCEQKSLSGRNLIPITSQGELTARGVTCKTNNDGSLTFIGNADSSGAHFYLANGYMSTTGRDVAEAFHLDGGDYVNHISGDSNISIRIRDVNDNYKEYDKERFTVPSSDFVFDVFIRPSANVNATIFPMIEKGTVLNDYEPYVGGIPSPNPSFPQQIKAWDGKIKTRTKNLLNSNGLAEQTINGVTFTPIYSNGKLEYINVNGTATANAYYMIKDGMSFNGTYILSGVIGSGSYELQVLNSSYNAIANDYGEGKEFTADITNAKVRVVVRNGYVANNLRFYPMIRLADTDASYQPFSESTADLDISLYGIKVASGGNYTDADGQMWLCDKLDLKKGVIERNISKSPMVRNNFSTNTVLFRASFEHDIKHYGSDNGESFLCTIANKDDYPYQYNTSDVIHYYFSRTSLLLYADISYKDIDLTNEYVIAEIEPYIEPLTAEQITALRMLQTYSDGTYVEYGTLEPFAEISYWTDSDSGKAVADVDSKVPFRFGITEDGKYGYYKAGADSVTPFSEGGSSLIYHIRALDLSGASASISVYNLATGEEKDVVFTAMQTASGYDFGDFSVDYGQTALTNYTIHAKKPCKVAYRNVNTITLNSVDLDTNGTQTLFAYNDRFGEAFVTF